MKVLAYILLILLTIMVTYRIAVSATISPQDAKVYIISPSDGAVNLSPKTNCKVCFPFWQCHRVLP